ncbi:MAG: nucleotidyl transferase AbiEii/AbiGii toxin family protein [Candidatus Cybelea sp.]
MKFQDVARLTRTERSDYISAAATDLGLSELIVEKDFWVVWLLEHIFALSPNLGPFTFKGGTSLSKGFNAIRRFSEDIDISISRATLGFPDDSYFYEAGTRNETKHRVKEIRDVVRDYTTEAIEPALRARIGAELSTGWGLNSDPSGGLRFQYPTAQRGSIGYVLPDVLLEFGHADAWPAQDIDIRPYVVEAIASVIGSVSVHVLDPRRTFWEKATILHELANREEHVAFPPRYSRHYYDLALLSASDIAAEAIQDPGLLEAVVNFKNVFFYSKRARYVLAKPGTLRLMFPLFRRQTVAADYEQMTPMLFGDVPSFEEICDSIGALEARINGRT